MKPMPDKSQNSQFYSTIDLAKARQIASTLQPAPHQNTALKALQDWFEAKRKAPHGGIMVLPTGGGKTFTAIRFLCRGPLSHGYKVLWLAHTHHLLNQAYYSFAPQNEDKRLKCGLEVGLISENRTSLNLRVISGTPGHCTARSIKADDDVIFSTLQTLASGMKNLSILTGLKSWLKNTDKLVVVFDEAHHSPAPSYRELLEKLRKQHPDLLLLGLTATPTHSDESKRGWLKKLFPQGILHQVSPKKLMLDKILAKPIFETCDTKIKPEWNEREFQKWLGTYSDLPKGIIEYLAKNKDRNAFIAQTYADNRAKYGKTIIFAERWLQCEQLKEFLEKRKIRTGVAYSHVESLGDTAEERNRRDKTDNDRDLEDFRTGKLDVIINVRMLTEGTDVPDVNTVFLTRQTTSHILLTQMVGRALRGPKFGGTSNAYIVSFQDDWQQTPPFATYELYDGKVSADETAPKERAPIELISIEIVKQLSRAMDRGINVAASSYKSLLPLGWYATTFDAHPEGRNEDVETVYDLVLVFDKDQNSFQQFINSLKKQDLTSFSSEDVTMEKQRKTLQDWHLSFFASDATIEVPERLRNMLDIARHMAQRVGSGEEITPPFISFEARQDHDLDQIAHAWIQKKLDPFEIYSSLTHEFERSDRLWKAIYPSLDVFKTQYDGCINRILKGANTINSIPEGAIINPELSPEREPSEEVKRQVKERDGRCLCCGSTHRLEVDHIAPMYSSGNNDMGNLQTLCKSCNNMKCIKDLNFKLHCNRGRHSAPKGLPNVQLPEVKKVRDKSEWERFLRRILNFFYGCGAVHTVVIAGHGKGFYEWEIELYEGNDPQWLKPYIKELRDMVKTRIHEGRNDDCIMERLIIKTPNAKKLAYPLQSKR